MKELMSSKKVFYALLGLNFIVSLLIFGLCINQISNDQITYIGLAKSLLEGKYTFWFNCGDHYFPDTLRNPGYPLFLALLLGLGANLYVIKSVQLLLFFISYFLCLKLLYKHGKSLLPCNIFLSLTVVAPYITIYTDMIFPEILMLFLITLVIYLDDTLKYNLYKAFILGILYGFIFQIRPVFLFFPLILILYNLFIKAKEGRLAYILVICLTFITTMIPYGIWNYKTHDKFSITSLEGGAGVMHVSYWAFRMPNYSEKRYWGALMGDELIDFTDPQNREQEIKRYNEEWNKVDSTLKPLLTKKDSIMLACFKNNPVVFRTYSARYTIEREKLLRQLSFDHMKEDFWYMVKIKLYSLPRLWVTGIQKRDVVNKGLFATLWAIAPFVLTLLPFLLFISVSIIVLIRKIKLDPFLQKNYLFLIYFGLIHLPFAIQARYTTPVRFALFMIIAIILGNILTERKKNQTISGKE